MQSRFSSRRTLAGWAAILTLLFLMPAVADAQPVIEVTETHISLTSLDTGAGSFNVLNTGDPGLVWTVTVDKPWVVVVPIASSGPGVVGYTADLSIPAPGEVATATFQSNGGTATVEFKYSVLPPVNGTLGVYADMSGIDCNIVDNAPGLLTVHVVHTLTGGSFAMQFSAPVPGCAVGMTWLFDTKPFGVTIGDSQTGAAIGYGACLGAPILVMSINYMTSGLTPACCAYPVLGWPGSLEDPYIVTTDCSHDLQLVSGATTVINGDASCPCMLTVRTEETTWGKVKSLYATDPTD